MSKFKVGDEIVINLLTGGYSGKLKFGSVAIIGEFSIGRRFARMVGELNIAGGWHNLANIKHAEKWSIYNNTLPWSELSDKQKGKLLLANINDVAICMVAKSLRGDETFINNVEIDKGDVCVYRAQPKPVKPEPTMAELLTKDILGCSGFLRPHYVDELIAKGWTKPCK
jgi:hypothetical protein